MHSKIKHTSILLILFLIGIVLLCPSCIEEEQSTEPFANHKIYGKVTDVGNNPIPDILVTAHYKANLTGEPIMKQTTNKVGEYELENAFAIPITAEYVISYTLVKDANDESVNIYKDATREVIITESDLTGAIDGWFKGYFEEEIHIKMEQN